MMIKSLKNRDFLYFKGGVLGLIHQNHEDRAYLIIPVYQTPKEGWTSAKNEKPIYYNAYPVEQYLKEMIGEECFIWSIPVFTRPDTRIQPELPSEEKLYWMEQDPTNAKKVAYNHWLIRKLWNRLIRIHDDSMRIQDEQHQLQLELHYLKAEEAKIWIEKRFSDSPQLNLKLEDLQNKKTYLLARLDDINSLISNCRPADQTPQEGSGQAFKQGSKQLKSQSQKTKKPAKRLAASVASATGLKEHPRPEPVQERQPTPPIQDIPEIGDLDFDL